MERKTITIGHLFPEVLNMYGDRGNILALKNRLQKRDIDVNVIEFGIDDAIDFALLDIVILGGGSDREQKLVCERLCAVRENLIRYIENDGVFLALCGSYPMLGKHYVADKKQEAGLFVLEIDTEPDDKRHIGDVIVDATIDGETFSVVGFENHSGKTDIGALMPLGNVTYGFGNNGCDMTCGVLYKNLFGTYLHGPLLPKNPRLTDVILSRALKKKYGEPVALAPLCDTAEEEAHNFILNRYRK